MGSAGDRPRPEPRQRPGPAYEVSVAGRSAVFRRRRYGPALLREAPRCSCPAVACGDRGVSDSTWAAGLLFGADGAAVTVSLDRTARDASPATATTSHATTVPASMRDAFSVPSCPANVPEVSRGRRLPYLMAMSPASGHMAHRVRSAPAARRSSAMADPCPRGCISRRSFRHTRVSRKLRFGTWASPSTSYVRRARTGFPPAVWSPSLSGWLPTTPPQGGSHMAATIAPAPKRHQRKIVSTLAATAQKADLAPRHYRIAPPGDVPAEDAFGRFRPPAGSDGALRLGPRARRTPPRRGSSSRRRRSPPCRAGRGSRRAARAPSPTRKARGGRGGGALRRCCPRTPPRRGCRSRCRRRRCARGSARRARAGSGTRRARRGA